MFLEDRYQVGEPIGRGSISTICRGYDTLMNRDVTIKVLKDLYSDDPKFVARFQNAAKTAVELRHPNIVEVYDYGRTHDNIYYIIRELVDGTDLRRYLRTRGMLASDKAIIIAHDVALGLGAIHRHGIRHGEVCPKHILIGRDGSIKLVAASVDPFIGPHYYAPEQAKGEEITPTSDIYDLGIVMYEILTARTPFDGDSPVAIAMQHIHDLPTPPSQFNPNIPYELEEIVLRCLEKKPENRYQDGSQLAQALEALPRTS